MPQTHRWIHRHWLPEDRTEKQRSRRFTFPIRPISKSSQPSAPSTASPTSAAGIHRQEFSLSHRRGSDAMPSPPIVIYRGSPYAQPQPEHHMSPAPPVSVPFPDTRQPYAPISLSKPSPNSSRRSSLQAVGPESLSDSFNSGLEFGDQESSRPISRLSSVSDPVIPDASLLVEAAVLRGREKTVPPAVIRLRQLRVPARD